MRGEIQSIYVVFNLWMSEKHVVQLLYCFLEYVLWCFSFSSLTSFVDSGYCIGCRIIL